MDYYIGTKLVQAEPSQLYCGEMPPPGGKNARDMPREDGYKVVYSDGYESWCPKNTFEKANLKMTVNPNLKTDKPSISQEMVDDYIKKVDVWTVGEKTTVVQATLQNGFSLVESSACVSAENYDEELGKKICMGKIKDKVWFLLGFLLQTAVHGSEAD